MSFGYANIESRKGRDRVVPEFNSEFFAQRAREWFGTYMCRPSHSSWEQYRFQCLKYYECVQNGGPLYPK